jgi:hypothetical protein
MVFIPFGFELSSVKDSIILSHTEVTASGYAGPINLRESEGAYADLSYTLHCCDELSKLYTLHRFVIVSCSPQIINTLAPTFFHLNGLGDIPRDKLCRSYQYSHFGNTSILINGSPDPVESAVKIMRSFNFEGKSERFVMGLYDYAYSGDANFLGSVPGATPQVYGESFEMEFTLAILSKPTELGYIPECRELLRSGAFEAGEIKQADVEIGLTHAIFGIASNMITYLLIVTCPEDQLFKLNRLPHLSDSKFAALRPNPWIALVDNVSEQGFDAFADTSGEHKTSVSFLGEYDNHVTSRATIGMIKSYTFECENKDTSDIPVVSRERKTHRLVSPDTPLVLGSFPILQDSSQVLPDRFGMEFSDSGFYLPREW